MNFTRNNVINTAVATTAVGLYAATSIVSASSSSEQPFAVTQPAEWPSVQSVSFEAAGSILSKMIISDAQKASNGPATGTKINELTTYSNYPLDTTLTTEQAKPEVRMTFTGDSLLLSEAKADRYPSGTEYTYLQSLTHVVLEYTVLSSATNATTSAQNNKKLSTLLSDPATLNPAVVRQALDTPHYMHLRSITVGSDAIKTPDFQPTNTGDWTLLGYDDGSVDGSNEYNAKSLDINGDIPENVLSELLNDQKPELPKIILDDATAALKHLEQY